MYVGFGHVGKCCRVKVCFCPMVSIVSIPNWFNYKENTLYVNFSDNAFQFQTGSIISLFEPLVNPLFLVFQFQTGSIIRMS